MTLEELKKIVNHSISKARTKAAIDEIIKWAKLNNQKELENNSILLKGQQSSLDSEKRLGLVSNETASTRQNRLTHNVLSLLDTTHDSSPIQDDNTDNVKTNGTASPTQSERLKILMLTANPANTTKLNLDKEHSIITQKLQQKQERFNIILKKAVSGTEFKEFTQEEQPVILHFSGHGEQGKYAGIVVQNDDKNGEALIPINGLKALFKFFKKHFQIKIVLLNACYTHQQAATISEYVDYVIGTNVAIGDKAASAFSSGFYFQLAKNDQMNVEDAFDSGRTEAVINGADEENFVIYRNGELIEIQ